MAKPSSGQQFRVWIQAECAYLNPDMPLPVCRTDFPDKHSALLDMGHTYEIALLDSRAPFGGLVTSIFWLDFDDGSDELFHHYWEHWATKRHVKEDEGEEQSIRPLEIAPSSNSSVSITPLEHAYDFSEKINIGTAWVVKWKHHARLQFTCNFAGTDFDAQTRGSSGRRVIWRCVSFSREIMEMASVSLSLFRSKYGSRKLAKILKKFGPNLIASDCVYFKLESATHDPPDSLAEIISVAGVQVGVHDQIDQAGETDVEVVDLIESRQSIRLIPKPNNIPCLYLHSGTKWADKTAREYISCLLKEDGHVVVGDLPSVPLDLSEHIPMTMFPQPDFDGVSASMDDFCQVIRGLLPARHKQDQIASVLRYHPERKMVTILNERFLAIAFQSEAKFAINVFRLHAGTLCLVIVTSL